MNKSPIMPLENLIPLTGKLNPKSWKTKIKFQDIFGKTLLSYLAKTNPKIVAITPAMPTGSGLVK